jgi:hypothetical protein
MSVLQAQPRGKPRVGDSLTLALVTLALSMGARFVPCSAWLERSLGCFVIATLLGLVLTPVVAIMTIRFLPRDLVRGRRWQGILSIVLLVVTFYERCGRPTEFP